MSSERILITLTPAELEELDKYCLWLRAARSKLISDALHQLFGELEKIYPKEAAQRREG